MTLKSDVEKGIIFGAMGFIGSIIAQKVYSKIKDGDEQDGKFI